MFCKNCGQPLEDGALFCANCNAPVEGFSAGNAAQPQTPPVNAGNPYDAQPQAPYGAPQQPYGYPGQPMVSQESASMGLRVLCWFSRLSALSCTS